ncbi:hypothetical protein FOPE_12698 [Fonsecaea pedrosoi]|nr:hypothetical protein FOPE_12698 [Fonsecaea pedrosoi]
MVKEWLRIKCLRASMHDPGLDPNKFGWLLVAREDECPPKIYQANFREKVVENTVYSPVRFCHLRFGFLEGWADDFMILPVKLLAVYQEN